MGPSLFLKGVYPYKYMISLQRFTETALPSKELFYSILDENITAEQYLRAKNVWGELNVRDLGEYHDIYLVTDVLFLVDVFEDFSFSFDALLKRSRVELDLFSNEDMYAFIERGIRDGLSVISKRHARANTPRR